MGVFIMEKVVSIIIPIKNQYMITKMCIDSIKAYTDIPYELILINDGSTDEQTATYLKEVQSDGLIEYPTSLGWCQSINAGIKIAV